MTLLAKGGGGGGRSSGGSKSSGSKSSSSSSSKSTPTKSTPKATKKTAGSKVKSADGTEVQSSTKTPSNTKYSSYKGIVGDEGYSPKFKSGYSAPVGSTVYYPQRDFIDYLPWIYIFSMGENSPRQDDTVIVHPDGTERTEAPVREGMDGMLIFNWILLIVVAVAFIGGIVWLVNKLTGRNK